MDLLGFQVQQQVGRICSGLSDSMGLVQSHLLKFLPHLPSKIEMEVLQWCSLHLTGRLSVGPPRSFASSVPRTGLPSCFSASGFNGLIVELQVSRYRGLSNSIIAMLLKVRKSTSCKVYYWCKVSNFEGCGG